MNISQNIENRETSRLILGEVIALEKPGLNTIHDKLFSINLFARDSLYDGMFLWCITMQLCNKECKLCKERHSEWLTLTLLESRKWRHEILSLDPDKVS